MVNVISLGEWEITLRSMDEREIFEQEQESLLIDVLQAVQQKDYNELKKLLRTGAPINKALNKQMTALGVAASNNDLGMIEFLLKRMASPSVRFAQGRDASWLAMEVGAQESFEFLYSKIDNPTLRLSDGSNFTRLISATESSNVRAVRFLSNKKVRVNDYDFEGRTALHHNFAKVPYNDNDMEIARILLNIGGDPNAEDFDDIPAHALAELPAQKALLEGVLLKQFAHDALLNRRKETAEIEDSPVVKTEPDDPGFPQLRRKPRLRM